MRRPALMLVTAAIAGGLVAAPVAVVASHSFTDVPDSNTFHEDIAWLQESGVTSGCNPPENTEFCPEDEVTREQMAAFMRRFAQFLGAEDGIPAQAVNAGTADTADHAKSADTAQDAEALDGKSASAFLGAEAQAADSDTVDGEHASAFLDVDAKAADSDRLDGYDLDSLAPRAAYESANPPDGSDFTLSVEIEAPSRGILLMTGGSGAYNPDNADDLNCYLWSDVGLVPGSRRGSEVAAGGVAPSGNCTTTGAVAVDAGTYSIDLEILDVAADTELRSASVWVMWVPFDGTGAVPSP